MLNRETQVLQDSHLVASVLQRDRKATAEFVAAHADAVHNYVRRRLFPRTEAVEDIVQDVFLDALDGLSGYRSESGLRGWLLGIARHKLQDHYRNQLRECWLDPESHEPIVEDRFEDWMAEKDLNARVERTMADLPDPYRIVLVWRYWEKSSAAEMAARTGKSEKAMERMLARAREQFRRRWYGE